MFVVVDPKVFPTEGLEARLQSIVDAEFPDGGGFPVRVAESCNSSADLIEAGKTLDAQEWHPAAAKVAHAWGIDAHTSTWGVTFDPSDPDAPAVADALKDQLGGLVTIDWEPSSLVEGCVDPVRRGIDSLSAGAVRCQL